MTIKTIIFSFVVFAFLFGQSPSVFAIGQMTAPIVIENAKQGETFEETLYIFNTNETEITFKLLDEGDVEGWVKFYDSENLDKEIEKIVVPQNSRHNVMAIFSIPEGTPNGNYAGSVSIETVPGDDQDDEMVSTSVSQKISREVNITVTDIENIDLKTSIIPQSYNMKNGEPLSIRFIYDNQSNIKINPQIQVKIKKDGVIVHNAIYPYPEDLDSVNSFSMKEITPLSIQTTGLEDGKYLSEITIIVNEENKYNDHFSFTIGTVKNNNSGFLSFISYIGGGNLMFGWILIGGLILLFAILFGRKKIYSIFKFKNKKIL